MGGNNLRNLRLPCVKPILRSAMHNTFRGRLAGFLLIGILVSACSRRDDNDNRRVEIPDFNFPQSVVFKDSLSAYGLFEGAPHLMQAADDFTLLELSSVLFTDYAKKQRLVKIPAGTSIQKMADNTLIFPNGSILSKTFYYPIDARDTSLGNQLIETRLLIKENDLWNAATYVWNSEQTEATLELNGLTTTISWINDEGDSRIIQYEVPNQNLCMTCHQSDNRMTPLGPSLLNLNRTVERNGLTINQIAHLQGLDILADFDFQSLASMVDYQDVNASLEQRGRAYLAMNCAHCHNPRAWDTPAERDFDFRHQTSLNSSGIVSGKDKIQGQLLEGEMPFIGTTITDQEGLDLMMDYLNSL